MTGRSVSPALRPNSALAGRLAGFLPAALERDDRALFRDFVVLGFALFAVTFVAYALTLDRRGAIPRDGTTLAVGRDFLNIWGGHYLSKPEAFHGLRLRPVLAGPAPPPI